MPFYSVRIRERMPAMPLLRKDLKIGFLAGAVLLALAVVYALVLTFSGSPEPPQIAQAPSQEAPDPEPLFNEPASDEPPAAGEMPDEEPSPLGPGILYRSGQAPADWREYGFNGNPPVVTQTPTPGNRSQPPTQALPGEPGPTVDPLPQDVDPGVNDGMPATRTHVVAAGETLSDIAQKFYSDPNLYPLIEKANPRLDARRLRVGQKLLIPDRDTPQASGAAPQAQGPAQTPPDATGAAAGDYEVQPGDTLARIAARRFGRETLWEEIYKLNQDLIGPDPAKLKVGMKLKMPS